MPKLTFSIPGFHQTNRVTLKREDMPARTALNHSLRQRGKVVPVEVLPAIAQKDGRRAMESQENIPKKKNDNRHSSTIQRQTIIKLDY
ncbi:hypothetical protein EUGRSUZ_G03293 [Eucalyptus grandis]|uniref:Uncharacterized protein n=2 Tax=Eucalyptus grandis TaxID=71139 RepID=A0ACC3K977_EUCGR|nr:hypothetical protein EUGRSUZ_G03293 [Eucalyptus grandis]